MGKLQTSSMLRDVETIFAVGTLAARTDKELLDQFRSSDRQTREVAFAAIVERHGPMVLRTCRSILRDEHASEDAFQATFLVLFRRACSLWVRDSLGPWLHQVAHRVASAMRAYAARSRRHEQRVAERARDTTAGVPRDDVGAVVHQELARLPERYRMPILLCCLEGLTREQAAARLGWPMGTLQSRLARGRERLKGQLIKRGVAPSAGVTAAILFPEGSRAAVPATLIESTIRAAAHVSAVESARTGTITLAVATVAEGVSKTMLYHKLKALAGVLFVVGLISTGVGVWAAQRAADSRLGQDQPLEPTAGPTADNSESIALGEMPERSAPTDGGSDFEMGPDSTELASDDDSPALKYNDGQPDGKKSLGGSGEMIEFSGPAETNQISGVRIHGARYGNPQPPNESFLIYFLNADQKRILHTEMAPYSLFDRAPTEKWVDVRFDSPVELPKTFWVVLDFRAHQTKGVYVSYDTSSNGKHSRSGLPGFPSSPVRFGGDWMVEVVVGK